MKISRIRIRNFRNFSNLDISLGKHAVIVGENKIGKSNLVYALRLLLDPSLPESSRKLREEDFWDGLKHPLGNDDRITISVDIAEFETNENLLAVLAEHLIEPTPMVARLTYIWQPIPGLERYPTNHADYEYIIYGGDRPANHISYEVRRRLPLELFPALRDCEADLLRWTRSPLRPLLDNAASNIDHSELEKLAKNLDEATEELTKIDEVSDVSSSINNQLADMVGASQSLEAVLRFSPNDPDKLIRALRIFIDGGKRGISDASLGSANLLYFALKTLEYQRFVIEGDRDHTILAIEEPEAHLHPKLQRLIFRNYLRGRNESDDSNEINASTIFMTTHSPHIASVTPIKDFVILRLNEDRNATIGVSTADLDLSKEEIDDLERYIDVNRGEIFFSRGIILVEGDAERFLVPVLAKQQGYDLDELGISVCSILGTNFSPYLILLGPKGLNIPIAALTDYDPYSLDNGTTHSYGVKRLKSQMLKHLIDENSIDQKDSNELVQLASEHGIFLNSHTLEVDLFRSELHSAFLEAMEYLSGDTKKTERMKKWADDPTNLDEEKFLKDIESVGKGRFAQRLATIINTNDIAKCPDYILNGVKYVSGK